MLSFIASLLGGGGVGQKRRPLRSKSVSELVNVLDERFTIRLLKMTSLLITLAFLFFRCASILVSFRFQVCVLQVVVCKIREVLFSGPASGSGTLV